MTNILVTGANGFIGQALCKKLIAENWQVRGTVRTRGYNPGLLSGFDVFRIESIGPNTDWSEALLGVDCVVHLAAHVHLMGIDIHDQLTKFREINVAGTERLARQSAIANVRRFIFMSSVKVNGEGGSTPYNEDDDQKPQDYYALSKWEAEKILGKIAKETGMEIVILRSPLVYGLRVKANFLRLLKVVDQGIPLPFSSIKNQRSLIYLKNLINAIVTCINHPKATGNTYFVSDGEDVSTPELVRRISSALGKPARLFPFPPIMLKMAGIITGKSSAMDRLLKSLTIDSSKIRRDLDWHAPFSMDQGLRETSEWYIKLRSEVGGRGAVS